MKFGTDVMTVPLHGGHMAIVDTADFGLVSAYRWHADIRPAGIIYVRANEPRRGQSCRTLLMHRLILGFPPSLIDHRNGVTTDNRRCNLRTCTFSQNFMNRKKQPGLTSRFKGVYWDKSRSRWGARIKMNRKTTFLGRFLIEEDAARAYDVAALELFGDFARLNDIPLAQALQPRRVAQ